jgi:hypothetical protein
MKAYFDGIQGQFTPLDFVHRLHFRTGHQAVSHVRLVSHDRQQKTGPLELLETSRSLRIKPELLQPSRREASPVIEIQEQQSPYPDREIPPVSTRGQGLPFRLPALQGWMADQAMPHHDLESLGQGRYQLGLT